MIYAVVKLGQNDIDLRYVGDPCTSFEEARELICARLHGDYELQFDWDGSVCFVSAWDGDHLVANYAIMECFWSLGSDEQRVFL